MRHGCRRWRPNRGTARLGRPCPEDPRRASGGCTSSLRTDPEGTAWPDMLAAPALNHSGFWTWARVGSSSVRRELPDCVQNGARRVDDDRTSSVHERRVAVTQGLTPTVDREAADGSTSGHRASLGFWLVLASACAYGCGPLFAKSAYGAGIDWLTLLAWRFVIAATLAWLMIAAHGRAAEPERFGKGQKQLGVVLGLVYLASSSAGYAALERVPASLQTLILYAYPALVAILASRLGRPLKGRRAWFALGLALTGVGLAVGGFQVSTVSAGEGVLLAIAAPVIYSVWIMLMARLGGERGGTGGNGVVLAVGVGRATAVMLSVAAVVVTAVALLGGRPLEPWLIPQGAWPSILGASVVATLLGMQLFYAGTQRIGAARASLVSTVEPVWTIALAWTVLGERLTPVQGIGGVLVLAGVVVAQAKTPVSSINGLHAPGPAQP